MLSYLDLVKSKVRVIRLLKNEGFKKFPNINLKPLIEPSKSIYGLYEVGSQFKGRMKIWINLRLINKKHKDIESAVRQLDLTLAHEIGHSFVDCIDHYQSIDPFNVPDWREYFNNDEELFVELFAMYLIEGDISNAIFFEEFIPAIAKEYTSTL